MVLLDSHYHLDYLQDLTQRQAFIDQVYRQGIGLVAQTVLPSQFPALVQSLAGASSAVQASLGFHPWWIQGEAQAQEELAIFEDLLSTRRQALIGEIGLDYAPKRLDQAPKTLQLAVLKQILLAIKGLDRPAVLSVHTVRSTSDFLDLLDQVDLDGRIHQVILHRFNGTSDELTRHIRRGGYLSVHPSHFNRKKGRAYLRQVPADRLLLETDAPTEAISLASDQELDRLVQAEVQSLEEIVTALGDLRQTDMRAQIQANQVEVYGDVWPAIESDFIGLLPKSP